MKHKMKIKRSLENILANGFNEKKSFIKQDELEKFIQDLDKLDPEANRKKGFSLPLLDTIGRNLIGNVSFSFKNY